MIGAKSKLINLYGQTETTGIVTTHFIADNELGVNNLVPIGRPIANTTTYILDKHMKPVPVGVPGELYIGGSGLARGYVNKKELTTQRFIKNPFDSRGTHLYCTGDRARYLTNGDIAFLGRVTIKSRFCGFESSWVRSRRY